MNKAALSSFNFGCPVSLLFCQCLASVLLVKVFEIAGFVSVEPLSLSILQMWIPVNVLFVGMTWTSFAALRHLGVPMATVLKNLTNLFVIAGDIVLYGKRYGLYVWVTLALMTISAICGAFTDMEFNTSGYIWQLLNCGLTAGYSLYLRGTMDKVVTVTKSRSKLNEFSMVYFNNLLSLPFVLLLLVHHQEHLTFLTDSAWQDKLFVLAFFASCLLAFFISFALLWFLSITTTTTFSLTGSLNKVVVAFIGFLVFRTPLEAKNVASVLVGLFAGAIFVKAKQAGR